MNTGSITGSNTCTDSAANDNTPVDPAPTGPTPLFTKAFCHPVELDLAKAEKEFTECASLDEATCVGSCKFSTGVSLIPDSDFCAPADLTDDVKQIMTCVSAQGEAVCAPPCKWRRGTQAAVALPTAPANNEQGDLTGPMFSKNFCHPSSTQDWEAKATICLP